MNTRAAGILKFLTWVLFVGANALSLIFLAIDMRSFGIDYWTLAYVPMNLVYVVGGAYVALNLDFVLRKHRARLIQALLAMFAIDTIYTIVFSIAAEWYPSSIEPYSAASTSEIVAGTAVGFGFSILILFVMIRLINLAASTEAKKPPVWMTAFAWLLVLLMLGAVLGFFVNG